MELNSFGNTKDEVEGRDDEGAFKRYTHGILFEPFVSQQEKKKRFFNK
jgi:hypothetical protein